jgi:hypothetical protein
MRAEATAAAEAVQAGPTSLQAGARTEVSHRSTYLATDRSVEAKTARLVAAKERQRMLRRHGVAAHMLLELALERNSVLCRAFSRWSAFQPAPSVRTARAAAPPPAALPPPPSAPATVRAPSTPTLQKRRPGAAASSSAAAEVRAAVEARAAVERRLLRDELSDEWGGRLEHARREAQSHYVRFLYEKQELQANHHKAMQSAEFDRLGARRQRYAARRLEPSARRSVHMRTPSLVSTPLAARIDARGHLCARVQTCSRSRRRARVCARGSSSRTSSSRSTASRRSSTSALTAPTSSCAQPAAAASLFRREQAAARRQRTASRRQHAAFSRARRRWQVRLLHDQQATHDEVEQLRQQKPPAGGSSGGGGGGGSGGASGGGGGGERPADAPAADDDDEGAPEWLRPPPLIDASPPTPPPTGRAAAASVRDATARLVSASPGGGLTPTRLAASAAAEAEAAREQARVAEARLSEARAAHAAEIAECDAQGNKLRTALHTIEARLELTEAALRTAREGTARAEGAHGRAQADATQSARLAAELERLLDDAHGRLVALGQPVPDHRAAVLAAAASAAADARCTPSRAHDHDGAPLPPRTAPHGLFSGGVPPATFEVALPTAGVFAPRSPPPPSAGPPTIRPLNLGAVHAAASVDHDLLLSQRALDFLCATRHTTAPRRHVHTARQTTMTPPWTAPRAHTRWRARFTLTSRASRSRVCCAGPSCRAPTRARRALAAAQGRRRAPRRLQRSRPS